jgi:hypothetical protein
MRSARGKIGGHLSSATRLEGKAWALEKEGKLEEAKKLREEAANHRRIARKLRTEYYSEG